MLKRTLSTSLVLVAALTACGGGGGPISLSDLGNEVASANCDFEVRCGFLPDTASCATSTNSSADDIAALKHAQDLGRLSYDADKAGACVDAIRNASCDLSSLGNAIADTCGAVFVGLVADGGTCFDDKECVSTSCSQQSCTPGTCCAGTCVAKPADVPIGGDCSTGSCVDGAHCQFDAQTQTQTCVADIAEGGACQFGSCADGLYCDVPSGMSSGTCKKFPAEGEACTNQCARIDDYCDATTMKCAKRHATGEACTADGNECAGYAYCNNGTCAVRPGAGETCDATNGPSCLGSLDCGTNNTCQLNETPTPSCP
jgi:hypothetical protein